MNHIPDTGHLCINAPQVSTPRVARYPLPGSRSASSDTPIPRPNRRHSKALPRPSIRSPRGFIAIEIVVGLSVLLLIIFSGLLFTLHAYGRVSGRTAVEDELRSLVLDSRLDNLPSHPDRQQAIAEAELAISKRMLTVAPNSQIHSIDVKVPEPDATTSVMMALRRSPIEVTVHASQCIGPCSPATRYEYTVRASGYREISSESSNIVPTDCNGYPISDRQRYKKFPCPCSDSRRHSDPLSGLCVCLPHLVVDADGGCQCPSPFQSFNESSQSCDCNVGELTAYCANLGMLINGSCGCGEQCPTGSIIQDNRCGCPDGTQLQNHACVPCPPGTAGTGGLCHACPAGSFAAGLGNTACQACPGNSISAASGASSCDSCPADSLVNGNRTECICASGKQMNASKDGCTLCPSGTAGSSGTCTSCAAGTYTSTVGNASCLSCPDGSIAPQSGAQACQACPSGGLSDSAHTACTCPNGTGLSNDGTTCVACPQGTFGAGGTCSQCPAGTFASATGNTACQSCAAGTISSSTGASQCDSCPANSHTSTDQSSCECNDGFKKDGSSDACVPCSAGTAGTDGQCTACPKGSVADQTGQTACTACSGNTVTTDGISCMNCGANSSPNSDKTACVCNAGYVKDNIGQCVTCSPGTYQSGNSCIVCPAGSFSNTAGSTSCTQCSTTSIQPTQGSTSCTNRPSNASANSGRTACICDNGYKSDGNGGCVQCSPGTAGTGGSCTDCAKGYYTSTSGKSACDLCPSGQFQTSTGASSCLNCPSNSTSWSNRQGCKCDAGYYMDGSSCQKCPAGSAGSNGSCSPCSAGKYSNSGGSSTCLDCPAGTIQPATGQSSCQSCPSNSSPNTNRTQCVCNPGYAPDGNGVCQQCTEGQYGTGGLCYSCPVGTHQDAKGQTSCKTCSSTDYQPSTGQTSCLQCPANSTANSARTACVCNSGYTMNAGVCEPCPQGTRGENGACIACAAGTYSSGTGNTSCTTCPNGSISASGASACTSCQNGQVANPQKTACVCAAGSTMVGGSCQGCQPGTQWVNGSCTSCPAGTYSGTAGSTSCTNCPQGQVSLTAGSSACQSCGPNATPGNDRASCNCDKGYTKNGSVCELCPAGTYGNNSGGCLACSAGSISSPDRQSCIDCTGNTVRTSGDTCGDCPAPTLPNQQRSACITCGADEIYVGGLCAECPGTLVPVNGECKCPQAAIAAGAAQATYGFSFDTQSCSVTCAGVLRTKDGVTYCLDPLKCGEYISSDEANTEVTCSSGFILDPSSGVCTCLE